MEVINCLNTKMHAQAIQITVSYIELEVRRCRFLQHVVDNVAKLVNM